jgi:hypothetical protein
MVLRSALAAYGLTVTQCIDVVTKRCIAFGASEYEMSVWVKNIRERLSLASIYSAYQVFPFRLGLLLLVRGRGGFNDLCI